MGKLEINLDSYKDFFASEHGLKLIAEIIAKDDYYAIREFAQWEQCASKVLDEIATRFMAVDDDESITTLNLKMLEEVAENPKISGKTLDKLLDFASGLLSNYRYNAFKVLEEIAESKKLNEDIAKKLYKVALEYSMHGVIEELAENKNTPDEILFEILDSYDEGTKQYSKACKQIIKRYKKMKEQKAKNETE